MKNNKQILLEILAESLMVEKEEEPKEEEPKDDTPAPSSSGKQVVKGDTDNTLMRGRPPDTSTDTTELANTKEGAKELLKTLKASGSGSDTWQQLESLFNSATKNKDFGSLLQRAEPATNEAGDKTGVLLMVRQSPMNDDAKAVYFFLRSLYLAGINANQIQISSGDRRKMRFELTTDKNFIAYAGKAKSWNGE